MIKQIFITITLFTLTAYAATRALQGDIWKSNDLTKTWTPPSATDTLMGLGASQTVTGNKLFNTTTLRVAGSSGGLTTLNSQASGTTRAVEFPDLTGTVALTSGAQTFSDKTLLAPNISGLNASSLLNAGTISGTTIIAVDNIFTIQDNTTPTKKAQFELSGISASTTRTVTLPNFNFTPAAIDQAQTWTAIPNLNAGVTVSGTVTFVNPLALSNGGTARSSGLFRASGALVGANPSLGTAAQASFVEITNASLTLTPDSGSAALGVMCSSTNAAATPSTSATTCSAGSESIGVAFTILRTGLHEVCINFTAYTQSSVGSALGTGANYSLIETATNSQTPITTTAATFWQDDRGPIAAATQTATSAQHICRVFNFSSTGTKGVRLMYKQAAITGATNLILADDVTTRAIWFSVNELGQ